MSVKSEIDRIAGARAAIAAAIEKKGVSVPTGTRVDGMGPLIEQIKQEEPAVLPTLDSAYPKDASVMEAAGASANFSVVIAVPGKPAEYTYQWYKDGAKVSGATSSGYVMTGLTSAGSHTVYCEVTNKAGLVTSRIATVTVLTSAMQYTYSGSSVQTGDLKGNWEIEFKTTGKFRISDMRGFKGKIDVFCVGGGGAGGSGGGAGGRTSTLKGIAVEAGKDYTVTVGAGGVGTTSSTGAAGGTTSAFTCSAAGGGGGRGDSGGDGGSGGGAAGEKSGSGGSNGGNGNEDYWGHSSGSVGKGQGTTTGKFGDGAAQKYAGGGGGSSWDGGGGGGGASGGGINLAQATNGVTNMGGGGGGWGGKKSGDGGSGIVIIRNAR